MTTGRINQVSTLREQAQGARVQGGLGQASDALAPRRAQGTDAEPKASGTPKRPQGFSSG